MTKEKDKKSGGRHLNLLFILGLILAIIIIVFGLANNDTTDINFLVFKNDLEINETLLIFLCIITGSIMAILFSIPGRLKRRKEKQKLEKELKDLRKNYEDLAKIESEN